jgi:hypothetical protein
MFLVFPESGNKFLGKKRRGRERVIERGEIERERKRDKERLTFSIFPESGNKFLGIKFPSQNSGWKNLSSRYRFHD